MIYFYNGKIDERPTLDYEVKGRILHAFQMNPDGSVEAVYIDDFDYEEHARVADYVIDATEEDRKVRATYLAKQRIGKCGGFAEIGDIVKVVKGRKYPKDLEFEVLDFSEYEVPGTYGHCKIYYLVNKEQNIRCDAKNVVIVDCKILRG